MLRLIQCMHTYTHSHRFSCCTNTRQQTLLIWWDVDSLCALSIPAPHYVHCPYQHHIMCTVHTSTTLLYHHNSGNAVSPKSATAVSPKTQVSWYAALCQRWRLCHPSTHQNNTPTHRALQLRRLESSVTWLITPQIYQPFNNDLHVPCLWHSYIHWQSQTAWWHTAGSQSSSTCRLCIGSHDTNKQSAVTVGPTWQTHLLGYDHKMTLHPIV